MPPSCGGWMLILLCCMLGFERGQEQLQVLPTVLRQICAAALGGRWKCGQVGECSREAACPATHHCCSENFWLFNLQTDEYQLETPRPVVTYTSRHSLYAVALHLLIFPDPLSYFLTDG